MDKFSNISKTKKVFEQDNNEVINVIQIDNTEVIEPQNDVVKLFSKLFESREKAHIYHLQVRGDVGSGHAHLALGNYYESVLELIDELIEVYQGQYDVIENYDTIDPNTSNLDKIEYFIDLANCIKECRKCISVEDTHLHNIIDEIVALIYKTLYKLRFNK